MNVISKDKYAGMTHNAADLVKSMEELQRKCKFHIILLLYCFISYML